MGFHIPTLPFELADIGLTPRRRLDATKLYDLALVFVGKSNSQYVIHLDENGEYTFTHDMLRFDRTYYQVFYDGDQKVLEAFYDGKGLILNLLTEKQTNLFVDMTVNECIIKASGPVCIDGKLNVKSALAISANALCFLDAVDVDGALSLTTQQGVGLLAACRAKRLTITAAYLYQSADISISQYDLSVQVFQQIKGSKSRIDSLRLVSEQCEIVGEFYVQKSCFLAANNLLIGDGKSVTRIELPVDHHIHVVNGVTKGQSSTVIGQMPESAIQGVKQATQWVVDESFFVDKRASLVFYNSRLEAKKIESRGDWSLHNCLIASQLTIIRGGSFGLSHSDLIGDKVSVFSGTMMFDNHSRMNLNDALITDETAHLLMNKSTAHVQHNILLFGTITMNRTTIHADNFRAYQTITLKKTQITCKTFFELQGDLKLNKLAIQAKTVLFAGKLDIDDATVKATTVDYQSHQGRMVKNFVRAESLSITGSDVKGNMMFMDSRLVFNTVTVRQHVIADKTSLVGVYDADICHNIEGILTLEQSQFITESQLHSLMSSHLELCKYSNILSGLIHSKGDMSARESAIYCDGLLQDGASLSVQSSSIRVNEQFESQRAELTFDAGSMVSAANVILRQSSTIRLKGKSVLAAREHTILGSNATLQSNDSSTYARKFFILGRAELCASLLSAQELLIYDRFGAQENTMIHVDERISLAKTAEVHLASSNMMGRDIETFGVLDVIDGNVHAEESMSFWSTSNTSLQGKSSAVAEDAVLRGKLVTKKKTAEHDEMPSTPTAKPILQIKKQMDISPLGSITGDEDLVLDADVISQSGTIELTGSFCARGRQFSNIGSVTASSIYLGFDDTVINHGLFSTKSMTIHSNFMNVLGQVYAKESLSCSGFVSLNMGLIAANNYVNDSFFSLNAGLIAPNLSADPKYIFSLANLAAVAKTAAIMSMPMHASGIQLFCMIPGFFSTAANLYHLSNRLDWDSLKTMRRHEYMPILCQVKNACMFGYGLYNHASSFGSEFSAWDASFTKMTQHPDIWASEWRTTLETTDWKQMGLRTLGAFGGSYTDTSLLHLNMGVSVAANTSKTNFMHLNVGSEQSLFSHNISTYALYNSGYSGGRESSFSATSVNNGGSLVGTTQLTLRAHKVVNSKTGTIQGKGAHVEIDEFHQDGTLRIEKGQLKITHFTDGTHAHSKLTDVALSGSTLDQHGEFQLKNVYIHEDEHVIADSHAHVLTDNVCVETSVFMYAGQLDYEHGLTVKAQTATFAHGSIVNGQRTSEDELFSPVQSDEQTASQSLDTPAESSLESQPEKEFKPQHVLTISAQKVTLNGRMVGGDYTQIQGQDTDTTNADGTKKVDLCDELVMGDSASIDLKYGSIHAEHADISGKTVLDSFSLHVTAGRLHQDGELPGWLGSWRLDN